MTLPDGRLGYYEFFAGGGMARLGLGRRWRCLMANEWDAKKARVYKDNFDPCPELIVGDVADLELTDLPCGASLAWASFPCQDLSLAGNGLGLGGERSGTFWPFWRLMMALEKAGRPCPVIVLENVVGALTSNQGKDFRAIAKALVDLGYRFGPMLINARHFLPQSRPRLFIVAVRENTVIPARLEGDAPSASWHPSSVITAHEGLEGSVRNSWVWWSLPKPPRPNHSLLALIEAEPGDPPWHSPQETARLLSMMSTANLAKLKKVQGLGRRVVGTAYRRTRNGEQRVEVRFDQISGCLRTPVGGSSRQIILLVEGDSVRSRLLSAREAARLMGLPDSYRLPRQYNEAYHLIGDGLAVPVVSWLEKHLLLPLGNSELLSQAA